MRDQNQGKHENMKNKNEAKVLHARRPLFANHYIECVNDIRCPLIEG